MQAPPPLFAILPCPAGLAGQQATLGLVKKLEREEMDRRWNADWHDHPGPAPLPQVRLQRVLWRWHQHADTRPGARAASESAPAQPHLRLPISSVRPALHGLSAPTCAAGVLQGWRCRVLYALWRLLRFFAATIFVDVAAMLGLPIFKGSLCFLLVCHYWMLLLLASVFCDAVAYGPWERAAAAGVACLLAIHAAFQLSQDLPARESAVNALQRVAANAAALRDSLPQAQVPPNLRAAMEAWAECCTATLQRDLARLRAVHLNLFHWKQRLFFQMH